MGVALLVTRRFGALVAWYQQSFVKMTSRIYAGISESILARKPHVTLWGFAIRFSKVLRCMYTKGFNTGLDKSSNVAGWLTRPVSGV